MKVQLTNIVLACFLCSPSCGGGEEPPVTAGLSPNLPKTTIVLDQISYSPTEIIARIKADSELKVAWEHATADGYSEIRAAGYTGDSNDVRVLWAELVNDKGQTKTLLQHCVGPDCQVAFQVLDSGGAHWVSDSGESITPRGVGLPVLLKLTESPDSMSLGTAVDTRALELSSSLEGVEISNRQFLVVNSFGDIWGEGQVSLADLVDDIQSTGYFTDAREVQYVRDPEVLRALSTMDKLDVLVWVSQGIRMNTQAGGHVTLGLTTNQGGFGDEAVAARDIKEALLSNPLGGPGLLFIAACDVMGDGDEAMELVGALAKELGEVGVGVIGFQGCDDARIIIDASILFWEVLLENRTVIDAVDSINGYLEQQDSPAKLVMLQSPGFGEFLPLGGDAFWEQYSDSGQPGASFFQSNVNGVNSCQGTEDSYSDFEFFIQPWSDEVLWDGPMFWGTRKNPDHNIDLTISGALTRIEVGESFSFIASGDMGPDVTGLTIIGQGVIKEIVVPEGAVEEFEIRFDGTAIVSDYTKANQDVCTVQPTMLLSTTGEQGTIRVPVSLRPAN
jgi:hypothetical protein